MPPTLLIVLAGALSGAVSTCSTKTQVDQAGRFTANLNRSFVASPPRRLASFELEDHRGQSFARTNLEGHWTWLFFGYTSCPDVCPMTLSSVSRALDRLAVALRNQTRVVFVSIDPEHDDRKTLARYVAHFGAEIVGITGSKTALDAFVDDVGASYRIGTDATGGREVEHSTSIFLIDPETRLVGTFLRASAAERVAADFLRAASQDDEGTISATAAFIPRAPDGSRVWAGYLTLSNTGNTTRELIAASSAAFAGVQIHETIHEGGRARMRALERVVVPAGNSVTLEPGGRHLMMVDPVEPPQIDHSVDVMLHFLDGTRVHLPMTVRERLP